MALLFTYDRPTDTLLSTTYFPTMAQAKRFLADVLIAQAEATTNGGLADIYVGMAEEVASWSKGFDPDTNNDQLVEVGGTSYGVMA